MHKVMRKFFRQSQNIILYSHLIKPQSIPRCTSIYNKQQYYFGQTNDPIESIIQNKSSYKIKMTEVSQWKVEVVDSQLPCVLFANSASKECEDLYKIIEEKADEAEGLWKLVSFSIDEIPQLASAIQIKNIPFVLIIHEQKIHNGFKGYPDKKQLAQFFQVLSAISYPYETDTSIEDIAYAKIFIEKKLNLKEISQMLKSKLVDNKVKNKYGAQMYSLLALSAVYQGDKNQSQIYLKEITKFDKNTQQEVQPLVNEVKTLFEQVKEQKIDETAINDLLQQLENDPNNFEKKLSLAKIYGESFMYEEAIQTLLEMIKLNKDFKEATELLFKIFNDLGSDNPIAIQGRKKLQKILY